VAKRNFFILSTGAICSVFLVFITLSLKPSYKAAIPDGELFFPKLIKTADTVMKVKVQHAGDILTFEKGASGWGLVESDNYPVQENKIAQVIFGLSQLKFLEAKTRKKDRLKKLHLENPGASLAKSQQVTLYDKDMGSMADLIVGRGNFSLPQTAGAGGIYVRRPNEEQAWLALGHIDLGVEPRDWLVRQIIDINEDQVEGVIITHPDGTTVKVNASPDGFVLVDIPAGKSVMDTDIPRSFVSVIDNLLLNDVRKANKLSLADAQKTVVNYSIKGGTTLNLTLFSSAEKKWITVRAVGGEKASQINARTSSWAYNIPDYHFNQLSRRSDQLLQEIDKKS